LFPSSAKFLLLLPNFLRLFNRKVFAAFFLFSPLFQTSNFRLSNPIFPHFIHTNFPPFLAAALYNWSMMPNKLEMNAALICASHFCYLFSFIRCVKKWWKSLAW
jgi:hypothetical protein